VGRALRRLATAVVFVLLLDSAYGCSNGSLVTKRPSVGAVASPQACRLLQFLRKLMKARAHRLPRVSVLTAKIWVDALLIYRTFALGS
jgi:hypothetical protein